MGQRLTACRAPPPLHTRGRRRTFFRVRREEVTPDLLRRIAQEREAGRLGSVTLDCRKTEFDSDSLDTLEKAAGISRLVLEC